MAVRVQSPLNQDLMPVRANGTIRCFCGLVLLTFKEGFWLNLAYTSFVFLGCHSATAMFHRIEVWRLVRTNQVYIKL